MNTRRFARLLAAVAVLCCVAQPGIAAAATSAQAATGWDDRFAPPGIADGSVAAVAVAANGDVYAGGIYASAGGVPVNGIARWDGRRWHALGAGLQGGSALPTALVATQDGVIAVGSFEQAGAVSVGGIAAWDGTAWSVIGNGEGPRKDGMKGWLYAVEIFDGKLIVGGYFDTIDGVPANNIAQWDGAQWQPLGNGVGNLDFEDNFVAGDGEVRALTVDGDVLYVGGKFALAGDANTTANSVATWDGAQWRALGAGVILKDGNDAPQPGLVASLAVQGGAVYAGGRFIQAGTVQVQHVAVFRNGAWSSLGAGLTEPQFNDKPVVNALLSSGTTVYAGGIFVGAGGQPISFIARWDGAAWSAVGGGIPAEDDDKVNALAALPDGTVLIAGNFRRGGDKRVDDIARWDGAEWLALGQGVMRQEYSVDPARLTAMAADEAGRVYVGGIFTRAGGVASNGLAMWDGARWHNLGATNAPVRAIAISDEDVYIGGTFTQAGGVTVKGVARWHRATRQWSALGAGIVGEVNALAIGHGVLYAGGDFTLAGGVTAHDVAYWDGTAWHALGSKARIFEVGDRGNEVGTQVHALAIRGDSLYIGGSFQTVQFGTNTADLSSFMVVHNVVEWHHTTDTWLYLGDQAQRGVTFGGFSGFQIDARALAVIGDVLYVGGRFDQAGGLGANSLAAWNAATEQWRPLSGVGGFSDSSVWGLAEYGDQLFVAGHFTSAGTAPARFIAQFDTSGGAWSALGNGLAWYNDRFTEALSVAATAEGVYVGGDFDKAGGIPSNGFAHWRAALGGEPLPPPPGNLPFKTFMPFVVRR